MRPQTTIGLIALAFSLAACADNQTTDDRGYTKAPLERPTVLVTKEDASVMDSLGDPARPDAPYIAPPPDSGSAGATAGGAAAPAATPGKPPVGATQADVDAGHTIFTSTGNCYTCHGPQGGGTAMAPALNDQQWIHIDGSWAAIQKLVHTGVPKPKEHPAPMPPMGGAQLSDQQIKQVAAFVYSLSHK